MGRVFLSLSVPIFAMAAAPVSAGSLQLEPSSDWQLRQYDDKCRMVRKFGEGEDEVSLWIEKAGEGRYLNMTVIGRPFRSPSGPRVTVKFTPGDPLSRGFITNISSKGRPVLTMFGVAPIAFDEEPESETGPGSGEETVDLTFGGEPDVADPDVLAKRYDAVQAIEFSGSLVDKVYLKTGGLAAMVNTLQQCADTLPEKRLSISSGGAGFGRGASTTGERQWAAQIQANYPSYLLMEIAQGKVDLRVQVNPKGRATFCEIKEYAGPAGFNDAACLAMLRYARFAPATDSQGNPVWGTYATRVTYRVN